MSAVRRLRFYIVFTLLATLAATAQETKKEPAVTDQKKGVEDPKASMTAGAPVDPKSYKLGPEDVIFIKVWREPDLSGPVMVRPDGKITLPLVGELQAGGETPESLAKVVTESL